MHKQVNVLISIAMNMKKVHYNSNNALLIGYISLDMYGCMVLSRILLLHPSDGLVPQNTEDSGGTRTDSHGPTHTSLLHTPAPHCQLHTVFKPYSDQAQLWVIVFVLRYRYSRYPKQLLYSVNVLRIISKVYTSPALVSSFISSKDQSVS